LPLLDECAARYGDTFLLKLAGYGKFIMLSDPGAVRDVFRGDAHALHSGEGNEFMIPSVGRNSVLVLDDHPHARQRRILLPPLKGERMRSFFSAMQIATLEALQPCRPDRPVRMLELMQQITLRVILQTVLGLGAGPRRDLIERQVQQLLIQGRNRHTLILVKLLPVEWLQRNRALPFYRQMHALNESLYAIIAAGRADASDARAPCVLTDLLAATHEGGEPLTDEEVRDAILTIILAGHDTTAIALAWALEQIVPRQEVVDRIRRELVEVAGALPPSADQLNHLEYLDAAIRESLRTRTVLPFVVRLTKQAFTAGGHEYPRNVVLCPCSHLVHRRPELYPDPLQFRPERFLERSFAGHEWFPFGGGTRTCLGMAFALYEMKVVLSTMFSTANFVRPPRSSSNPVRRGVALAPHDGVRMIVTAV
jgi:cytochrome P450